MAAIATSQPPKRKARFAPGTVATPSPLPISKRARFEASTKTDEEKAWDSIMEDMDRSSPIDEATPSSPASSHPAGTEPSIADTSFTSASTTRKRPKRYLCEYEGCGKAFDRPVRLQMHIRSHTNERPYACEEDGCDKTFLRSEHLKRHMKDKHSEEKDYICTYNINTSEDGTAIECGKSFTTASRLKRHTAAHEAKEETKCQEPGCGKVFRKQETLQRHIKQDHLHEKAFQCEQIEMDSDGQPVECQQAFAKLEQLKNHQAREHSGLRYFCDICSPPNNDHHAHDEMSDFASLTLEPPRIGFPTYTDLQHHLRAAHPPTCTTCGKQCESNRALKAHIDIEHSLLSDRQHHNCTWLGCERRFTKAGNLKVHMQNVHAKARNFVCGDFDLSGSPKVEGWNAQGCGSAFGTKANLEEHVRTQHLGLAGSSKIRAGRKIKAEDGVSGGTTPATLMDVDELATPDTSYDTGALSMLTGLGYGDTRKLACLVAGCPMRFGREYDLAQHLELTHGWQIDDVNERLGYNVEEAMMCGGGHDSSQRFWIGGLEEVQADEALRRGLEDAMRQPPPPPDEGLKAHEEVMQGKEEFQRQMEELQSGREEGYARMRRRLDGVEVGAGRGVTVNGAMGDDGSVMVIDPALRWL